MFDLFLARVTWQFSNDKLNMLSAHKCISNAMQCTSQPDPKALGVHGHHFPSQRVLDDRQPG
jgi:hypothetical protein